MLQTRVGCKGRGLEGLTGPLKRAKPLLDSKRNCETAPGLGPEQRKLEWLSGLRDWGDGKQPHRGRAWWVGSDTALRTPRSQTQFQGDGQHMSVSYMSIMLNGLASHQHRITRQQASPVICHTAFQNFSIPWCKGGGTDHSGLKSCVLERG